MASHKSICAFIVVSLVCMFEGKAGCEEKYNALDSHRIVGDLIFIPSKYGIHIPSKIRKLDALSYGAIEAYEVENFNSAVGSSIKSKSIAILRTNDSHVYYRHPAYDLFFCEEHSAKIFMNMRTMFWALNRSSILIRRMTALEYVIPGAYSVNEVESFVFPRALTEVMKQWIPTLPSSPPPSPVLRPAQSLTRSRGYSPFYDYRADLFAPVD